MIAGTFTVLTATLGVLIVVYQLRRQAENTQNANRDNEMMKLKKEVYEEAALLTQTAMNAIEMLRISIPSILEAGMEMPDFNAKTLKAWNPETSERMLQEARTAVSQLMVFIDRRAIMDPGLYIFRMAFKYEWAQVQIHHSGFWHAMSHSWKEEPGFKENLRTILLGDTGGFYSHTWHLLAYMRDFTVEAQNLLLGELFKRAVDHQREEPPFIIRLADHEALRPRFQFTQEWEYPISTPPPRQNV